MALNLKTLKDDWKKVKPAFMPETGVGQILAMVAQFDIKDVKDKASAKQWMGVFNIVVTKLSAAASKEPIKSNKKVKQWLDNLASDLGKAAMPLGQIVAGVVVYDPSSKGWVLASEMQADMAEKLRIVKDAWPKLSADTRDKIVALAKSGK